MNIIAELHTHTNLSHHAHHTLDEMFKRASVLGLKAMAITNHGPALPDGVNIMHFATLWQLPEYIEGVYFIKGAEANIVDHDGKIDLTPRVLDRLQFVIASMHESVIKDGGVKKNTNAYLKALENPKVHCLGHCGNPNYPMDHEAVVKKCAELGKIIEINAHSDVARTGSGDNCRDIARLCAKHGVRIILTTDAHSIYTLGEADAAIDLVQSAGYPEELIINTDMRRLSDYFKEIAGIEIPVGM